MSKLTAWLASLAVGVAVSTGLVFGQHEYVEPVPVEPTVHRSPSNSVLADGFRTMQHAEYVAQLEQVAAYLVAVEAQHTDTADPSRSDSAGQQTGGRVVPQPTGSVQDEFVRGWRAGGGVEGWLQYVIDVVVRCESGWRVDAYNPVGPYYGLGQWLQTTWSSIAEITGLYDIYDPYHQGFNMGFKTARDGGAEWGCW